MYEQDFEKSVQKAMEELSFAPSAPVWAAVSAAIGAKRKKRPVLLWALPIGLVMTGLVSWWFYADSNAPDLAISNSGNIDKRQSKESKAAPDSTFKNTAPGYTQKAAPSETIISAKDAITNDKTLQQIATKAAQNYRRRIAANRLALELSKRVSTALNEENFSAGNDQFHIFSNGAPVAARRLPLPVQGLAVYKSNGLPDNIKNLSIPHIATLQSKQLSKTKSRYTVSLQLQYGVGGLTQRDLFSGDKSALYDAGVGRPDMSGGNASVFYPAAPQNKRFFAAGLGIGMPLLQRISLSSGLLYQQYTQQSYVGQQVQRSSLPANISADVLSNGSSFYSPTSNAAFVNRYHFVAVPFSVHYSPFKRVPLAVHGGAAVGYLFAAKSLQYDTASKVFYQSKAALQKWQTALSAGVEYRVASGNRWHLYAGPRIAYHLRSLRSSAAYNNGHLFQYSIGLQLQKK